MTSDSDDLLFLLADDPTEETPAPITPVHPLASAPLLPRSEPAPKPAKPVGNEKWKAMGFVTLENCIHGTGPMEKLKPGEIAGKSSDSAAGGRPKRGGGNPSVISFGKHSGKLIVDVHESDPQYLAWCIREDVQGMREKCAKLGITEDDFE